MQATGTDDAGRAWESAAAASGWLRGAATRGQALAAATGILLDRAGVTQGHHVLDLGTGTGDQALIAAERVGPTGWVLATDISDAMLDLARQTVSAAGHTNVELRRMDAQRLELDDRSFDAVIGRCSLQFVPDVAGALGEIRRVLKPGARFAALVFSSIENNPYRAAPQAIASRYAGRPFPEPGPGQWALNDPDTLRSLFSQAGFQEIDVSIVQMTYDFPTLDAALQNLREAQPLFVRLLGVVPESEHPALWAEIEQTLQPYVGPDGFKGPSEVLIASGAA